MAIIKSISPKIKTQTHLTEALSYITQDKKASDVYYHRCAKRPLNKTELLLIKTQEGLRFIYVSRFLLMTM